MTSLSLTGPIDQHRIEDLQVLPALIALISSGAVDSPVSVAPGGDPPDSAVRLGAQQYGLELTELTASHVRSELTTVRALGRAVQTAVNAGTEYEHLDGRQVSLAYTGDQPLPQRSEAVELVLEILREDRGTVGEGIDFTDGPPAVWPQRLLRAARGAHGPGVPERVRGATGVGISPGNDPP